MLLCFVKSKNGTKCKNFAVFTSIHSFLYFLRFQEGGLHSPPKSATEYVYTPLIPHDCSIENC